MTSHHSRARTCLACAVLLLSAAALPALAASSAASSASESVSTSSDSASASLKKWVYYKSVLPPLKPVQLHLSKRYTYLRMT